MAILVVMVIIRQFATNKSVNIFKMCLPNLIFARCALQIICRMPRIVEVYLLVKILRHPLLGFGLDDTEGERK